MIPLAADGLAFGESWLLGNTECLTPDHFPRSSAAAFTTGVVISGTVGGGVTNSGTISPNGIIVKSGAFISGGNIVDTGVISGGITVDDHSKIVASVGSAIDVNDTTTFAGGISNAGSISALTGGGIRVTSVTAFGNSERRRWHYQHRHDRCQ